MEHLQLARKWESIIVYENSALLMFVSFPLLLMLLKELGMHFSIFISLLNLDAMLEVECACVQMRFNWREML